MMLSPLSQVGGKLSQLVALVENRLAVECRGVIYEFNCFVGVPRSFTVPSHLKQFVVCLGIFRVISVLLVSLRPDNLTFLIKQTTSHWRLPPSSGLSQLSLDSWEAVNVQDKNSIITAG